MTGCWASAEFINTQVEEGFGYVYDFTCYGFRGKISLAVVVLLPVPLRVDLQHLV